mgnify:CR=1 FL=1
MAKGTVNKVTLIGRLGQDPEIRFTGDGAAVASFSVATNESWKSKDGEMQERTEWTKVTVFGSTAEKYVQPYVKKGTLVYIEGSLKTDKWQDKEGQDRYTTEIVGNEMQMLDSRGMSDGQTGQGGQSFQGGAAAQPQQAVPQGQQAQAPMAPAGGDDWDDDIPF